jgi:hypothetical protein
MRTLHVSYCLSQLLPDLISAPNRSIPYHQLLPLTIVEDYTWLMKYAKR